LRVRLFSLLKSTQNYNNLLAFLTNKTKNAKGN